MIPLHIKVVSGGSQLGQLKNSWKKNYKHYLQEALGLALFMMSACFFGAMLEGKSSDLHSLIKNPNIRLVLMGLLMGVSALLIFYSPFTAPSGAHINPAVTITFWRMGKLCHWDVLFYILFQLAGGIGAVYAMQWLMGDLLTSPPVNSVVTVPGSNNNAAALLTEFAIAFITMSMVLFTSSHQRWKKYTRVIASLLVCCWVCTAGPVSGFGMNPARSISSALPSGIWTAWWIYLFAPFAGMLLAAEFFLFTQRRSLSNRSAKLI